ncbi:MAG TPA: flagellar basal body rod protein FlgB [Usitatibacter sp.]|nr:flagellar basal body rod protein FlgB [Usitatibacter sp.]
MSFGIEGTTAAVVTLALDAATMRQQAIAANIANVNTPGYRPVRVRFEEQLATVRSELREAGALDPASLEGAQPAIEREPVAADPAGGSAVALDQEVAKLSANSLHYQVLLRALNRQLSIIGNAINDGKR